MMTHIRRSGVLFILPMLLFLVATTLMPVLYVFIMSFCNNHLSAPNVGFVFFENYTTTFNDPVFWKSIKTTGIYVFYSVVFHIGISLLLAVFLDRVGLLKGVAKTLRSLFIIPWLLSWSVASSIWLLILNPSGLLNGIAMNLGWSREQFSWLGHPDFAMFWIIFITVWKAFPFFMMFIYAALTTVPEEIYESADLDGASKWKKFSGITIPYILPTILTLTILDTVWSLRQYDVIFLTTAGGPLKSTQTLTLSVYFTAFEKLNFGAASAQGIAIFLLSSLAAIFYVKIYSKTEI